MEQIDWKHLPFKYMKTDFNIRTTFKDGKWSEPEISGSEYMNMHIAATAIHYGQECFEGLKAYMGKDGRIRLFRWQENARRMQNSAHGIMMEPVPEELFGKMIRMAVKNNLKFVPPYGTGASLYIRPFLFGSGAEVGVKPAKEYTFIVLVTPVGPYYKNGFETVDLMIVRNFDRTAPLGTGSFKVGGNYAASLQSLEFAHSKGYATALYLDSKEKKYIDEAGTANFFGIKNNTYITPASSSILPSITNKSLVELAESLGMKVEKRPVPVDELDSFEETGACGTAAVISPVATIYDLVKDKKYTYSTDGKPGPWSKKLYEHLLAIQYGDIEDKFGWIEYID